MILQNYEKKLKIPKKSDISVKKPYFCSAKAISKCLNPNIKKYAIKMQHQRLIQISNNYYGISKDRVQANMERRIL